MKDLSIVIVPRERFSAANTSLDSVLENTPSNCQVVYVDGNSPRSVRRYIRKKAKTRPITHLEYSGYLSPNRARNIGLRAATGEYVAFVDNDVLVTPNWLEGLVKCAEDTGAAVVGPLTCIGEPLHQMIHSAGLFFDVGTDDAGQQVICQSNPFADRSVTDASRELRRQSCDYVEFHCVLVRRCVFEQTGPLDEMLLSTREHVDFCLTVKNVNGAIYCEPASVVTYLPAPPLGVSDLPFFLLRWGDSWERSSLEHFQSKWQFTDDEYFEKRLRNVGSMRRILVKDYCAKFLCHLIGRSKAERLGARVSRITAPFERIFSGLLVAAFVSPGDRRQQDTEEVS